MSANTYLVDAATRHQVFLQRYGGSESKKAIKTLNRLRRDINARLSQEPTVFQRNRLTLILRDLDELVDVAIKGVTGQIRTNMSKLAANEAEFSAALFNKTSSVNFAIPSDASLIAAVSSIPMNAPAGMKAITIDEALIEFGAKKAKQIKQIITDGLALGDTTPEISKRLSSTINTLHRRQLDTLVRTAANHASSVARNAVYSNNSDILEGYEWVATLDNRTTLICGSRDGKVFPLGGPTPPAHWGCRSTTIPKVRDEFTIARGLKGDRPSVGASGAEKVSAKSTYGGWLKKQPKEFIDEALGVERSKLFRSGKLSIDKFVDPIGRTYTLEQLRSMNQIALNEF